MRRCTRSSRSLVAAIAVAVAAVPLAQVAHAGPAEPSVPSAIAVPAGQKLFLVAHAVGVQIYVCNETSGGFGWDFVAPRADLYDDSDKLVAIHFAGPTWQARDGSWVKGQVEKRVTVDPTAIQWLRLAFTSSAAGANGARLAGTTFIQRIATVGGLAPDPVTCNEETVGVTDEVPYTADYAFWKAIGD
jgi:Protein of unknown function (DUF3455)